MPTTATNNLQGRTKGETEANIVRLLGMDYEVFRNSVCFEQGKSDSFSLLSPKERKELVIKVLQLDRWAAYLARAKEELTNVEAEAANLEIRHQHLGDEIELLRAQSVGDVDIVAMRNELTALDERRARGRKRIAEIDTASSKLSASTIEMRTTLHHKRAEYKKLADEVIRLRGLIDNQQALIGHPCPVCKRDVTPDCLGGIIAEYQSTIASLNAEAQQLSAAGASLSQTLDGAEKKLAEVEGQASEAIELMDALNNRASELAANIERAGVYGELIAEKERQAADIVIQQLRMTSRCNKLCHLTKAFGRDGVPSYIMARVIPEIELIANHLIGEVLQSDMSIQLELSKQLKGGGLSDSLEIMIDCSGVVRAYDSYSGGEKFLIDFALRIALSVILARRKGRNIRTLIIDEGFGNLDDHNQDAIIHALNVVARDYGFKKIILITHVKDVQGSISNQIFIEKSSDGSKVLYNSK